MLSAIRSASASRAAIRAFSTSTRRNDLAKVILIGNLGKDPELKMTKNNKEFVSYSVATKVQQPPGPEGESRGYSTTWHRVMCYLPGSNKYLQTLKAGSKVYVEATYEVRQPEQEADPSTPQGQLQIFLKHESIKLLSRPRPKEGEAEREGESERLEQNY
ncbi:single-strand binding protein family-domain-containing protein [Mycena crocata]|nr:single-strand binding protein family-domain-containing protein [Mycena crocata]